MFQHGRTTLLNMDCMEYMRGLPDNAFDAIITSPPYNMNLRVNSKGDGYCSRQIVKEISTKYKNYSDNLPMDDYKKFLADFLAEALRVSDLVFFNIQQITGNKPAVASVVGMFAECLKETIVWDKVIAQPSIADGVLNSQFEFIYVFGGNPIARQFKCPGFTRGAESNLWRIHPTERADKHHGAGFPVALPQKIMSCFLSAGQRVYDPFLGTGTTAIAAHYGGFEFVGTELDRYYYAAAVKRYEMETAQQAMAI
jgi:site-specific DNA-methyltransferase (adenine-specific)